MSAPNLKLGSPPIVEAVLDLDCDMPPAQELSALEGPAREKFLDRYPNFQPQFLHEARIEQAADGPAKVSARRGLQALQLLQPDKKQLVQVRAQGFSFNRLAPYSSLDDYLPEIERTWRLFIELASPVQVRAIRLRYINRILLPLVADRVDLDDYLKIGPRLPNGATLMLRGFLNRHDAVEVDTGNQVTITLTGQAPEQNLLPIIFDIETSRIEAAEPEDWERLLSRIHSLRSLKNRVFRDALTEQCLELFR